MRKYVITFFSLIFLFTVAMTLVYCIPNNVIDIRQSQGVAFIKNVEGWYPSFFWDVEAAKLDNATDRTMLGRNESQYISDNPFESAMSVGGYSRYWHGYQVFLRPLLRVFNYEQIRFLNMGTFFILLCLSFSMLHKKLGLGIALCYIMLLIPLYMVIIPASLQYMSVFTIMFISVIYLTRFHGTSWLEEVPLFFMIIGMMTSFFDLLTAPLLTLGIPLAIYMCFELKKSSLVECVKNEMISAAAWVTGYGLCWISKWVISSLVLEENIILDAVNSVIYRTVGSEEETLKRTMMLRNNLSNMFFSGGGKIAFVFIVCILSFLLILFFFHKRNEVLKYIIPFMILAVFPYIWFMALANHSYIHAWFTYRIQAITVLGILLMIYHMIDWEKLSVKCKKILSLK